MHDERAPSPLSEGASSVHPSLVTTDDDSEASWDCLPSDGPFSDFDRDEPVDDGWPFAMWKGLALLLTGQAGDVEEYTLGEAAPSVAESLMEEFTVFGRGLASPYSYEPPRRHAPPGLDGGEVQEGRRKAARFFPLPPWPAESNPSSESGKPSIHARPAADVWAALAITSCNTIMGGAGTTCDHNAQARHDEIRQDVQQQVSEWCHMHRGRMPPVDWTAELARRRVTYNGDEV